MRSLLTMLFAIAFAATVQAQQIEPELGHIAIAPPEAATLIAVTITRSEQRMAFTTLAQFDTMDACSYGGPRIVQWVYFDRDLNGLSTADTRVFFQCVGSLGSVRHVNMVL